MHVKAHKGFYMQYELQWWSMRLVHDKTCKGMHTHTFYPGGICHFSANAWFGEKWYSWLNEINNKVRGWETFCVHLIKLQEISCLIKGPAIEINKGFIHMIH